MTDKQIIDLTEIDKKYKDKCSLIKAGKCKNVNIFIEQSRKLKAKEQECEELKEQLDSISREAEDFDDEAQEIFTEKTNLEIELTQLKAENKILKEKFEIAIKNNMDKTLLRLKKGDVQEELQEIREQFGIETLYCHVDNTRVHRCLDVLKLKDTLTEIKEIAESYNHYSAHAPVSGYSDILQKISECEENDE